MATEGVDKWLVQNKINNIQEFTEDSLDSLEKVGGLTERNVKRMREFMKKGKIVHQYNMSNEKTQAYIDLQKRYLTGRNLKAFEESHKTVIKRFDYINKLDKKDLPQNTKDWQQIWNGYGQRRINSRKDLIDDSIERLKNNQLPQSSFQRKVFNSYFGTATGGTSGYTNFSNGMIHTQLPTSAKKSNCYDC